MSSNDPVAVDLLDVISKETLGKRSPGLARQAELAADHVLFRNGRPYARMPRARWEALLQREGPPRGLGDTVARVTQATGLDRVARAWERATGKPCGCKGRKERLNRLVPYRGGRSNS